MHYGPSAAEREMARQLRERYGVHATYRPDADDDTLHETDEPGDVIGADHLAAVIVSNADDGGITTYGTLGVYVYSFAYGTTDLGQARTFTVVPYAAPAALPKPRYRYKAVAVDDATDEALSWSRTDAGTYETYEDAVLEIPNLDGAYSYQIVRFTATVLPRVYNGNEVK